MTLLKSISTGLFLFLGVGLMAQTDGFPFAMGIPEGDDTNYEKLPVKARLTSENYRSVGTKGSIKKYAPTPKSQGQYGTCTAWAAGFCARTIVEAQSNGWTDKETIDANTFAPGFIYRVTMPNRADCGGAYVSTCLERLQDTGIPKFEDFEEQCPQTAISRSIYSKAAKNKIKGFASLWNYAAGATAKEKVQLVKKSIDEQHPVVIAMIVPKSFCSSKGPVWYPDANDAPDGNQGHQHGRHAMCIVGYDDDKDGGAFLLQNSWGAWWGDKGYMWVRYSDASEYIYQAIEMFKLPAVKNDDDKKEVKETTLAGSLKLMENTGQEMKATLKSDGTYKLNKAYRSGTRFRMYLNNKEAAYVYAIGSDLSNKVFQVFPHQKGVSPYLNYSYSSVPIPSEDKHIRMDGNVGTDYLCVLYSQTPLDLDYIRSQIGKQSSRYTFKEKIERVIGSKLMSSKDISYTSSDGKMGFSAKAQNKTVATLFMEMEHID